MQLRSKSLLLLIPLIVIPLLLVGGLAYNQLKRISVEQATQQVTTLLDQTERLTRERVTAARTTLRQLSSHQLIHQYALIEDEATRYSLLLPQVLTLFRDLQDSQPEYYEIRFILPDGFEDAQWLVSDVANVSDEAMDQAYFLAMRDAAMDERVQLIHDENTNRPAILLSHRFLLNNPALDPIGTPPSLRGYLAINSDLDFLQQQLDLFHIGRHGILTVTGAQGEPLLMPHGDQDKAVIQHALASLSQLDTGIATTQQLKTVHLADGDYIIAQRALPVGMRLLALMPEDDLLADSRALGGQVALITILAILMIGAFVYMAMKRLMIDPIHQLNEAARAVGRGQLQYPMQVDSNDEIGTLAESFQSMCQNLQRSREEIQYLANHDSLTGLPNRAMFMEYLSTTLFEARQKDHQMALLFFDLDDFKQVNDTLGHQAGDELLQELAERLTLSLRWRSASSTIAAGTSHDLAARLGGDEFIILLDNIDGPMSAIAVADRLMQELLKPIKIADQEIYMNCSIGITLFPDDATDAGTLIKHADIAMYHAKENGKNHYQFYSASMNKAIHQRLSIGNRLRAALDNNHFELHYQPKVSPTDGRILGVEALLRWHDPEEGMIPPGTFIPVAEESGLITPITAWVVDEACRQARAWQDAGLPILPIAVNVSSIQFKRRDLTEMLASSLAATGLDPSNLEVELTETSLLSGTEDALEVLGALHEMGVRVALDDFGTGYSSLSYLNQFPIQTLKVDRSFVLTISEDESDCAIVSAIIALGHALGLEIVAEGVETELQHDYLARQGCDLIQGFLYSRPLPADALTRILQAGGQLQPEKAA